MWNRSGYCPKWTWWIRSGERLSLGLPIQVVVRPDGPDLTPRDKAGLNLLGRGLQNGNGLVRAMMISGLKLPTEIETLLDTGEQTGRLGETLKEVGDLLHERQLRIRSLIGQLWYPVMVLAVGMLVMGIILFQVIPQMRQVCASFGDGDLPWLTENIGILYGLGLFSAMVGLILTATLSWTLRRLANRSLKWGKLEELVFSRVPLMGSLRDHLREAHLLKQVGILLRGGITLPGALGMAADHRRNQWEREELILFQTRLMMGAGFTVAMQGCQLISEESEALLEAGQESGHLETYMLRIARDLESRADWKSQQAIRFLEPLFLVFLSGAIGCLILAYLLPMVRLLEHSGGAF